MSSQEPATITDKYADPRNPSLPPSDMKLDLSRTALVVTDPQIDFLSPKSVIWDAVSESVGIGLGATDTWPMRLAPGSANQTFPSAAAEAP